MQSYHPYAGELLQAERGGVPCSGHAYLLEMPHYKTSDGSSSQPTSLTWGALVGINKPSFLLTCGAFPVAFAGGKCAQHRSQADIPLSGPLRLEGTAQIVLGDSTAP